MCHHKAPHRPWDPAPRFKDLYKDVKIPEPETLLDDYKGRSQSTANARLRMEDMVERDPVAGALRTAPLDDEPESEGEKQAVQEAREWLRQNGGRGVPHEEAMRRLGLK